MKNKNYVYVISSRDDLELPEFVADTFKELAMMTGYQLSTLHKACRRNSLINNTYQIEKVRTDIFDDFDNFDDYIEFCHRLMLKPNRPLSLDLFKAYCYGV